jgi:hypothetical protein
VLIEIGYVYIYIYRGERLFVYKYLYVYTVIIKKKFGSENGTRSTHVGVGIGDLETELVHSTAAQLVRRRRLLGCPLGYVPLQTAATERMTWGESAFPGPAATAHRAFQL